MSKGSRPVVIAGNWKMHGQAAEAQALARAIGVTPEIMPLMISAVARERRSGGTQREIMFMEAGNTAASPRPVTAVKPVLAMTTLRSRSTRTISAPPVTPEETRDAADR